MRGANTKNTSHFLWVALHLFILSGVGRGDSHCVSNDINSVSESASSETESADKEKEKKVVELGLIKAGLKTDEYNAFANDIQKILNGEEVSSEVRKKVSDYAKGIMEDQKAVLDELSHAGDPLPGELQRLRELTPEVVTEPPSIETPSFEPLAHQKGMEDPFANPNKVLTGETFPTQTPVPQPPVSEAGSIALYNTFQAPQAVAKPTTIIPPPIATATTTPSIVNILNTVTVTNPTPVATSVPMLAGSGVYSGIYNSVAPIANTTPLTATEKFFSSVSNALNSAFNTTTPEMQMVSVTPSRFTSDDNGFFVASKPVGEFFEGDAVATDSGTARVIAAINSESQAKPAPEAPSISPAYLKGEDPKLAFESSDEAAFFDQSLATSDSNQVKAAKKATPKLAPSAFSGMGGFALGQNL